MVELFPLPKISRVQPNLAWEASGIEISGRHYTGAFNESGKKWA
jgi:hypothetical protein